MGVRASVWDGAGASRSEGEGGRLPQVIGEYTQVISRGDLVRVGEWLREHGYLPGLTLQAAPDRRPRAQEKPAILVQQKARRKAKREKRRLGRQAERRARSEARGGGVCTVSRDGRLKEVSGEP